MDVTTEWRPRDEVLNSTIAVLQDSFAPDSQIQRRVQKEITQMQKHPDFVKYLLYILKNSSVYDHHVRSLSAIILKNNLTTTFDTLSQSLVDLIRHECLQLMIDASKEVRKNVTTLMGTIVWKGTISSWPNLIPHLCNLVDSSDLQLSETALMALFKICEEYLSKRGTEREETNQTMNDIVVKFISLVTHERSIIRENSIKILNQAMQDAGLSTLQFDTKLYLNNLFVIIRDDNTEIQKLICQAFCIFIDTRNGAILGPMNNVIEYILSLMEKEDCDEEVVLQACEFWLAVAKLPTCKDILFNHAPRLLPLLFKQMKYSEYELDALKNYVGDDEHLEDRPDDIRPFNTRSSDGFDEECGDDGDYEHTDAIGEPYIGWTLRKCSAASLDALSLKFGSDMLPIFLPLLNEGLTSNDYLIKESAILALGAIAEGCLDGLKEYLPELMQYLLQCINSDQSSVRVITCWTFSRYMTWMMEENQQSVHFGQVMMVLLEHFLDSNKRVQRAALSAFCIFQEEARLKLVPYIEFILGAFSVCFSKFKFRSYLLLYDAIGVLAQSVGNHLNKPEYVEMLLPPLMHKFNTIEDYDDEQFTALIECLLCVANALDTGFLPYTEVIYSRCLLIINETITNVHWNIENSNDFEIPDREAMCAAHNMLLGLATGLKSYFVKFVTNSNLIFCLYHSMQDDSIHVRQPALALYGELAKLCFPHLSPTVDEFIPVIIENLDKRFDVVCNNAAWVIGKLCVGLGNKIEPYLLRILERFIDILQTIDGAKTMYQTVAISICTLGLVCPDIVAPHFAIFLRSCCLAIRNVGDCEEKELGFRGLCELSVRNPAPVIDSFIYFCDAVASWNDLSSDLKEVIRNILIGVQSQFGDNWNNLYEQFPPLLKQRLNMLYGI